MPRQRIVFCGLETYSLVGGLQQFNRRVLANLDALAGAGEAPATVASLLRDDGAERPPLANVTFLPGHRNRARFFAGVLPHLRGAEALLLGHINLLPLALLARLVRPRLPILLFVHGDEVWGTPGYRPVRPYEPWLLRLVDRIASVSAFTAGQMAASFGVPKEKFTVFPNAVDALSGRTDSVREPHHVLSVTRLGRGDRGKNIDKVLVAFAGLLTRMPDAVYEVVGDGTWRPDLEAQARDLGIAGSVRFHGRLSDADLARAYDRSSLFVLPSSKEGFGIVYLEAWLRDLPVICSIYGASSEVVTDGVDGFAVDPDDTPALTERMHSLLVQPERARAFGKAGHAKVEAQYLNPAFQKRLGTLLRNLVARR